MSVIEALALSTASLFIIAVILIFLYGIATAVCELFEWLASSSEARKIVGTVVFLILVLAMYLYIVTNW